MAASVADIKAAAITRTKAKRIVCGDVILVVWGQISVRKKEEDSLPLCAA